MLRNIRRVFKWVRGSDWCTLPETELNGFGKNKFTLVTLFVLMLPVYCSLLVTSMWLAIIGDVYNIMYDIYMNVGGNDDNR